MAKTEVWIPDGQFCSDQNHLGCIYGTHQGGLHFCGLHREFLKSIEEFKMNGETIRAFRKCDECIKSMREDTGSGLIPDESLKEVNTNV